MHGLCTTLRFWKLRHAGAITVDLRKQLVSRLERLVEFGQRHSLRILGKPREHTRELAITLARGAFLGIAQESAQRRKARNGVLGFEPVDLRNARRAGDV